MHKWKNKNTNFFMGRLSFLFFKLAIFAQQKIQFAISHAKMQSFVMLRAPTKNCVLWCSWVQLAITKVFTSIPCFFLVRWGGGCWLYTTAFFSGPGGWVGWSCNPCSAFFKIFSLKLSWHPLWRHQFGSGDNDPSSSFSQCSLAVMLHN